MVENIVQKSISLPLLKLGAIKLTSENGIIIEVNSKGGVKHYFFINYVKNSKECIIFGTGAINKKKVQLPYFDRLKWFKEFPCSVIYYFDSTLFLHERINLGWLYGNNQRWYMEEVESILRTLLKIMGVDPKDTLFVGSSGGGFTSCALATFLESKALVFNPQLICKNWSKPHIEALETVLKPGEKLLENRLDLNQIIQMKGSCPKLHIVQNVYAEEDFLGQIIPFVKNLSDKYQLGNQVSFDFYSNEKGHNGMVDNERTIKMILHDMYE